MKTILSNFFAFIIFFLYYSILNYCSYNPNSNHQSSKIYSIIINKVDTLRVVANKLYDNGLIKNKEFFKLSAKIYNFEKSIKSGDYNISNSLSIKEILNKLKSGKVVKTE